MKPIDADHASTTAPALEVVEAMRPWCEGARFGNPSSVHSRGEAARDAIENARVQVADLIGGAPEEIVFTATGSESNNLAIQGLIAGAPDGRRRLVVSAIEHPSVLETARHLESRGIPLTVVGAGADGIVDLAALEAALGNDVALVSVMWVNNEVGTVQPIAEIAALAHRAGARMHCDAIQAAGKLAIDVTEAEVDLLSLAGHKFHGPLGAAALWIRRRVRLTPLVHGGHQERSRRAGTENVAAIVGLGAAAARARAHVAGGASARVALLGERLRAGLCARVPDTALNGDPARRLGSIVNLRFGGVDGEAALHELDREGVIVSTGAACSAAQAGPSHVLLALGQSPEEAHASVRFSLGDDNEDADVDRMLEVVPQVVDRLRALGADNPRDPRPSTMAHTGAR
jgi:cysteine desulfurase